MSALMVVGQNAPVHNPYAVGQNAPVRNGGSPSTFFVRLLHALEFHFPEAAVLFALLDRQADLAFVKASKRDLSSALGCCVSDRHVNRALQSLSSLGLIESKTHPNTATRYRVDVSALLDLLATPIAHADVVPGLTPLPALARIFACGGNGEFDESITEGNHDA